MRVWQAKSGRRLRGAALLGALGVAATACGAQLPPSVMQQLRAAATTGTGGGGGSGANVAQSATNTAGPAAAGPAGSSGAATGGGGPAASVSVNGASTPAGASSSASGGAPVGAGECSQWGTGAPGVSSTAVQVATADTNSGPLPGATAGEFRGAAAYLAMVNAQGGVCGHKLVGQEMDDGLDPAQGRSQFEKVQPQVFGFAGNLSVADSGYDDLIKSTGVPWVGAVVDSNWDVRNSPNVSPHSLQRVASDAPFAWMRHQYPSAVKAAVLYTDVGGVTANLPPTEAAIKTAGFNIVYTAGLNPTAPDYTPQVLSMESNGVQMVYAFALEVNMQARLERDMTQQGFKPTIQSAELSYDTDYQQLLGQEGNGWIDPLTYAPFLQPSVSSRYPGMSDFLKWTAQVFPGAKNDLFSVEGWAYTALFVQALRDVKGPLTRQNFVAALQSETQWGAGGLEATSNPSNPAATENVANCFVMTAYQNGGWNVIWPTSGPFECNVGEVFKY